MYGTIFRMKAKPGQENALVEVFKEWEKEQQPNVRGAIGGLVLKPDERPGEFIGVAIFEDKTTYTANADSPDQHAWYLRLRELLEADPEWEDGEYIAGRIGQ